MLRTEPWRRAPAALLAQPRLLLAVVLVAVVLGFVAATPVVFLASVSSASVTRQLDPLCRGLSIDAGTDQLVVDRDRLAAAAAQVGGFGDPIHSTIGSRQTDLTPLRARVGEVEVPVQLGTRTGWPARVPGGATADDDRVWLPDTVAAPLGVASGDRVTLAGTVGAVEVEVGGVFPDVVEQAGDPYWCSLGPQLGSNLYLAVSVAPAPMVLVSEAAYARLLESAGGRIDWRRSEVPLQELPETLAAARDAVERLDRLDAAVVAEQAVTRQDRGGPFRPPGALPDRPITSGSRLRYVVARATAVRDAVQGAVTPMAAVSGLVALGLLAGVAVTWVDRRRSEVRLLWVRGVSPGFIGVKAVLEMVAGVAVGTAAGWGLAVVLVSRLGPGRALEPGTVPRALLAAGLAALAGLGVALVTVALRVRSGAEATPARRRRGFVPWEVAVLALAWWSLQRLRDAGGPVVEGDRLPPVDTLALVFPLLFLAGAVGLVVRLLGFVLRHSHLTGRRWPTAAYLALRRLAAESRTVVTLTWLLALAAGVVTYGAGLVRSSEATADAKVGVELGTDVRARIVGDGQVPPDLAGRATLVRSDDGLAYGGGDGDDPTEVDVLVVDPATFADAAYWDDSFADDSLGALLARLARPGPAGRVPAIAAGPAVAAGGPLSLRNRPDLAAEVEVVGTAQVWPGITPRSPLLVVPAGMLGDLEGRLAPAVWVRHTDETEVRRAAEQAGLTLVFVVTQDQIADTSAFLPTIWTFGFVQVLGAVVGVLSLVALLAYIEARQRNRTVGYALARRMGLTGAGHWRALVLELTVLAAVAVATGVTTGWLAVRAVNAVLDADPDRPPPALLRFPSPAVAATVMLALATVMVVAALAQRVTARADVTEVLRGEL